MIEYNELSDKSKKLIQEVCAEDLRELQSQGRVPEGYKGMSPESLYERIYSSYKDGHCSPKKLEELFYISGELVDSIINDNENNNLDFEF